MRPGFDNLKETMEDLSSDEREVEGAIKRATVAAINCFKASASAVRVG